MSEILSLTSIITTSDFFDKIKICILSGQHIIIFVNIVSINNELTYFIIFLKIIAKFIVNILELFFFILEIPNNNIYNILLFIKHMNI